VKPPQKVDLERRLEAYFATLRSSCLRDALKRCAAGWQIYAAVTGSAAAMATGASISAMASGPRDVLTEPNASVRLAQQLASSGNVPLMNALRLAGAKPERLRPRSSQTEQPPTISAGGVAPLDGTVNTIQPGEWVSIYGTNLADSTEVWNGDFPTSLGGTSVLIDGKPAYLAYVSPGQINLQAPDDMARGVVSVVVTTGAGSAISTVTLSDFAPSFCLLDTQHVCGIILRSNGSGAYGGGTYDILGPTGSSLGYPTVAAKPGDQVALFGVGLGPTNPTVPAGVAFSGAASVETPITLVINKVTVATTFTGLSSAGLYQINLTVPKGLGHGDVPIVVTAGGVPTQRGVLFSLHVHSRSGGTGGTGVFVGGGTGGAGFVGSCATAGTCVGTQPGMGGTGVGTNNGGTNNGGTGGGNNGGGTGGGTGGGSVPQVGKPYQPRLQFPK